MEIKSPILSPLAVEIFQTVSYIWAIAFIVFIVLAIITIVTYFTDKYQKTSTLRRNYPVIARFRYLFEHMGVFLRQYFFSDDREELLPHRRRHPRRLGETPRIFRTDL